MPATAKQEFEEAERRLQVRFPSQYRTWALARSRYRALKGFRLFVPAKCYDFVGSSGERSGIVIGATWEATHLVLKLTKQKDQSGILGEAVFASDRRGKLVRSADHCLELVERKAETTRDHQDFAERMKWAARLEGKTHTCPACGAERDAGICRCGQNISLDDPPFPFSEEEAQRARQQLPHTFAAFDLLIRLREPGFGDVPFNVAATATALEKGPNPASIANELARR